MFRHSIIAVAFVLVQLALAHARMSCKAGDTYYRITFKNFLASDNANFTDIVPENGLVFSPMAAMSHSNRYSFLTIRGLASPQVEQVAETGDNGRLVKLAQHLKDKFVGTVASGTGPVLPWQSYSLVVKVNCAYPMVTAVSMIAPSPDWIVQINNVNLLGDDGYFVYKRSGFLIAYDAGTDDGAEFTAPTDASLDMPSEPQLNIAPLREDETDPFGYKDVGFYEVLRLDAKPDDFY